MDKLIDKYYSWLKENTITSKIGEYTEVTTPFLDRHNDCIQFYMKMDVNNNVFLTDDGWVLNDLEHSGFSINTPRRKQLLSNILNSYHLELDHNNCITATASIDNFPFRKHFFIQGIIAINDLYTVNKSSVASLFADDVAAFMDDNNLLYQDNFKITGKSGYDHNIDYVLPGLKSKDIPDRYLKLMNNPNKSTTESILFTWQDIKNTNRRKNTNMYVILNDEDKRVIRNDITTALKSYDIKPLLWSDKKTLLDNLKNAG